MYFNLYKRKEFRNYKYKLKTKRMKIPMVNFIIGYSSFLYLNPRSYINILTLKNPGAIFQKSILYEKI